MHAKLIILALLALDVTPGALAGRKLQGIPHHHAKHAPIHLPLPPIHLPPPVHVVHQPVVHKKVVVVEKPVIVEKPVLVEKVVTHVPVHHSKHYKHPIGKLGH